MKQVKVKRSSALNSDAVLKNNTKTTEENVVIINAISHYSSVQMLEMISIYEDLNSKIEKNLTELIWNLQNNDNPVYKEFLETFKKIHNSNIRVSVKIQMTKKALYELRWKSNLTYGEKANLYLDEIYSEVDGLSKKL